MSPKHSRSTPSLCPPVARTGKSVLRSATVGALPLVNRLLGRTRLEEVLREALPKEDGRTKLSPTKALLVLLRNLLLSREPIYGLGEWAARQAPDLLGLTEKEVDLLNDDRVGRALDILTVTADGGVPLHFRAASGNVTDDTTYRDTWDLLCQLTGRRDFLYVADSKLATRENMAYLHQRQGRFITVLPKTRLEDAAFRKLVTQGQVTWRPLWEKTDEEGEVIDRYSTSEQPASSVEGYRLVWYQSQRKAEQDAVARAGRIQRTLKELAAIREKLHSPRTRYRQESKVAEAVSEILQSCRAEAWIVTEVEPKEVATFRQARRGRPSKATPYVRNVTTRFDLTYRIDDARMAEDAKSDGIFPLITNVLDLSNLELLKTYKRQPTIEKRFSQLKTDFEVAPVYLKAVHRIQALLSVYFFALLLEALLERELRQAMQRKEIESLPLYPEGRACRWPTSRRVLDLFEPVQRHTLTHDKQPAAVLVTELTRVQRRLLTLLGMPPKHYGH